MPEKKIGKFLKKLFLILDVLISLPRINNTRQSSAGITTDSVS